MLNCLFTKFTFVVLCSLSGREWESQSDRNELPYIECQQQQEVQNQGLYDRVSEERSVPIRIHWQLGEDRP